MIPDLPFEPHYDAVVVGARCAGAATALRLAERGLSVLVVDRGAPGTDTLSTHALMRGAVLLLERWGALDAVVAAGTPAVRTSTFHYGEQRVAVPIQARDGVDALYAPRRTVLDPILVGAARAAGARVEFRTRVDGLDRRRDGRIEAVWLRGASGSARRVGTDLVVGADGADSDVARWVDAEIRLAGDHAAGVVYGYWQGLALDGYHWYYRPGSSAGVIPTNAGTCVFASVPAAGLRRRLDGGVERGYRAILAGLSVELDAGLEGARRVGGLRTFPGRRGFLRRAHGPGWALVGDAGYFKDPSTAHGITDALRDAERLSTAVARGDDRALDDWEAERDELSIRLFEITDRVASHAWTLSEVAELHRELSREMSREVQALVAATSTPMAEVLRAVV
jgi:flavin-dependent dehydrogenase